MEILKIYFDRESSNTHVYMCGMPLGMNVGNVLIYIQVDSIYMHARFNDFCIAVLSPLPPRALCA